MTGILRKKKRFETSYSMQCWSKNVLHLLASNKATKTSYNKSNSRQDKLEGVGLIIGCTFLFTGRWANNWGVIKLRTNDSEHCWHFWPNNVGSCWLTTGSLSNDDGDINEDGKKAVGLDWQNNKFARASRFFVHFLVVTARQRCENA